MALALRFRLIPWHLHCCGICFWVLGCNSFWKTWWFRQLPFQSITPSDFCTDVQHCCSLSFKVSRLMELIHMKGKKPNKINFLFFLDGSVPHSCSLMHGCSACCASVRAEWVEILMAETGKQWKLLNQRAESHVVSVKPQPRFDQVHGYNVDSFRPPPQWFWL